MEFNASLWSFSFHWPACKAANCCSFVYIYPSLSSFLRFELGRRVGFDRQCVNRTILEFRGKDLVDQPVAFEEWHLFKRRRNYSQNDLGSTVTAPSLYVNVHMGNRGQLGFLLAPGADQFFGNGGHGCSVARLSVCPGILSVEMPKLGFMGDRQT